MRILSRNSLNRQTYIPVGGIEPWPSTYYRPILTAVENGKGVLDLDTVKGCTLGMTAYPNGGCYGECYAYKNSLRCGLDFTVSISRKILGSWHLSTICSILAKNQATWYRIGTAGDPCHDWSNTILSCRCLKPMKKTPVIITKHWIELSDDQLESLRQLGAVINTSTSGMDSDEEIHARVNQLHRIRRCGIRSVCRVVTCKYGTSSWAKYCNEKQDYLLSLTPIIDNPLRAANGNPRVQCGDIVLTRREDSIGGGKLVSMHSDSIHIGACQDCPDQCGVEAGIPSRTNVLGEERDHALQLEFFPRQVEFKYVPSVIGSGYENAVSELALEDGIAHRAARKNMQIHSAIILLINGEFAGFFTFQVNDICHEFCLLQSVIKPAFYTQDLYRQMVLAVIAQNTKGYPAIITTDPRSTFETPELFQSIGFKTYLKMSGFHYMVHGPLADVRMKFLAHITMTNVWNSVGADWVRSKKEWNAKIEKAGEREGIQNPTYATRDGCWQGENGFANVVTGHSHNGNASVLDPVACEIIARFFMPKDGGRIYNPFGGGVQFGFVAGSCGYNYLASEIRQNQCDANNKLCSEFSDVRWVRSDSSTYQPDGMYDLIFTCPPYYRIETYLDYDGQPPPGEINSMPSYTEFRDALFSGYMIGIAHLNDNRFFIVMTGDSRDKVGAYYCSEAETELFLKSNGLSVYNKIVYLEPEFTRLAHAKKTLNMRKFPKREQKIIVAYKGKIENIKEIYPPVGRL